MEKLVESLLNKRTSLSVIGLGYVGLPLAVAFSKMFNLIGFDINKTKVENYKKGIDVTKEVGNGILASSKIKFTYNEDDLRKALFHVVAVPTPINQDKSPDLKPVIGASIILGRNLQKGSIVVYESTVYPGVTEEICAPILEKESGLKCGIDFKIGYSPERINPGDKVHRLETITKIVSGMDNESLEIISQIYKQVVTQADIYKAESIKVAEAAKVIENSQRDINIAFMNELSIIFNKLGIDTHAVLKAASTKWNFINFKPGLVGGHCIGVDPYYLTYKAASLGYDSQVILSGRRINDSMGKYIAENTIKLLIKNGKIVNNSKVGILGFTFKENCQDTRNTRVVDIINELKEFGIKPVVVDDIADKEEAYHEYQLKLNQMNELKNLDALIIAVAHDEYKKLSIPQIRDLFGSGKKVLIDVKGLLNKNEYRGTEFSYWRL